MSFQCLADKIAEVCYALHHTDTAIFIRVEDYKEAMRLGIDNETIKKEMEKNIRHFRKYVRKYDVQQWVARLNHEDREREERKQALAEEKQRKEQERLQMINNARCSSRWFKEMSKKHLV